MDRFLEQIAELGELKGKISYKIANGENASYLSTFDYIRIDSIISNEIERISEQRKNYYIHKETIDKYGR